MVGAVVPALVDARPVVTWHDPDPGACRVRKCVSESVRGVALCGVPVAESAVAPPGSIPNPVVTHGSAGEYCRGDAVGGEAAAGAPQDPHVARFTHHPARGGAVAARWAHNPKVGGSNPPPATHLPSEAQATIFG